MKKTIGRAKFSVLTELFSELSRRIWQVPPRHAEKGLSLGAKVEIA